MIVSACWVLPGLFTVPLTSFKEDLHCDGFRWTLSLHRCVLGACTNVHANHAILGPEFASDRTNVEGIFSSTGRVNQSCYWC